MTVICISGTPCTGKTTLAKKLSKQFIYEYIDVNKLIKDNKLDEKYDRKKRCYVVDVKKLNKLLIKLVQTKKNLVIDSHLSHYLPKKYVDLCIITKCNLKTLEKRLKKRKYNKSKIRENLDCEIFDICLNEAKENKHKVLKVDTSKKVNVKNIRIK
ncbi:kinase [Candidatus Woesearchaeota archaeon B3_Woes]|nr:MAG: kinase [Candidatus Woesearchaeota archaeon B3_Woes]